jgi:hypothetical protein
MLKELEQLLLLVFTAARSHFLAPQLTVVRYILVQ